MLELPPPTVKRVRKAKVAKELAKPAPPVPARPAEVLGGGLWFAGVGAETALSIVETVPVVAEESEAKPPRAKVTKPKNDPRLVAAARELRDRWLEQVNGGEAELPGLIGREKYAVSRGLGQAMPIGESGGLKLVEVIDPRALPAPMAA